MNRNQKIAALMAEYFDCVDGAARLRFRAATLKAKLLRICNPGRYQHGTVYRVGKQRIEVRAYVRSAYVGLRRHK